MTLTTENTNNTKVSLNKGITLIQKRLKFLQGLKKFILKTLKMNQKLSNNS